MPVQDDARENQMIQLFNLTVPEERRRSDIDAHLVLPDRVVDFELKSTTTSSVSTVRDFGPEHIAKWRDGLHWLFAFYDKGLKLRYCVYASPEDMEPWIAEKERYILPDIKLADEIAGQVSTDNLVAILGEKDLYTRADAAWIMKKQWSAAKYREQADFGDSYSIDRMTEILRLRARYVVLRGATLNNPHIESAFFRRFDKITDEHAVKLRGLVGDYFWSAPATDFAIEYPTGGATEFPI